MFSVNFKKDWRMNKSLLISFFSISLIAFIVNITFYLLLRNLNLSENVNNILHLIWVALASIASLAGQIFSIILIYFLLKKDLGKNYIHNTIFTPQSLFSWILPKILFVFIIQGLFALLNVVYEYLLIDIANLYATEQLIEFVWKDYIVGFLTATFSFGFFALMTLWMALFYSFRKKGISWLLIIISAVIYFVASQAFSTYQVIQNELYGVQIELTKSLLIDYGIKNVVGIIFFIISFYLFDKKIEY